jgi:hypothetical protein
MKNKITVTGANITFFAFSVAFIFFQFALAIPAVFYKDVNKFALDYFVPITLFSEYILILVPVIVYVMVKKLDVKEVFRLNNPGLLPCLVIILIAIPASHAAETVNVVVLYFLSLFGKLPETPIPVPESISSLIVSLLVIAVTPAICEELLNRGIMMKAYESRGTMKAVVISSILFGVFHYNIMNLFGPILLGLLIGYYVVRTNSIFAGMLAHFLNNAYSMITVYFANKYAKDQNIMEQTVDLETLIRVSIIGVVAAIIVLLLLKLFNRVTMNRSTFEPSTSTVGRDILSVISHWPMIVVICLFGFMTILVLIPIIFSNWT